MLRKVIWLIYLCSCTHWVWAQQAPTLPDMAGATINHMNLLQFTNPYDALKSLDISRSDDSTLGFVSIAHMSKPPKGFNRFSDTLPLNGANYYRITVVFENGLSWTCNTLKLGNSIKAPMTAAPAIGTIATPPTVPTTAATAAPAPIPTPVPEPKPEKKNKRAGLIKIKAYSDTTVTDAANYFKSKYVSVDQVTGHILIDIPEVKKYPYTITFYSADNRIALEVPPLHNSPILLDRKNFQQKGTYHFIIKKLGKDFDQGYIVLE